MSNWDSERETWLNAMIDCYGRYRCQTRLGHWATVQPHRFRRGDFAYLGTISMASGMDKLYTFAWAWHKDGKSIDPEDRGFDLMDFKPSLDLPEAEYFHWLGKEAA